MIKLNIGKYIKKYRTDAGMTQAELAKAVGTSRPNIGSWESDRTEPSINDVQRIADVFGIQITDIIGDTNKIVFDEDVREFALFLSAVAPKTNRSDFFESLKKIASALAK